MSMTECFNGRRGGGRTMTWADTRVGAALAVLAVEGRRSRERSARSVQKEGRRRGRGRRVEREHAKNAQSASASVEFFGRLHLAAGASSINEALLRVMSVLWVPRAFPNSSANILISVCLTKCEDGVVSLFLCAPRDFAHFARFAQVQRVANFT